MRQAERGNQLIQFIGVLFVGLMMSTLAVDFAYYFAAQNQMQTAADSASLAAATELYRNTDADPADRMESAADMAGDLVAENTPSLALGHEDVIFGYIDPQEKAYDPDTFTTPNPSSLYALTGGYNAVYTRVRRGSDSGNAALGTLFANMFGVNEMQAEAHSISLIDNSITAITDGGVRPIYACNDLLQAAMADGNPENDVVRIYGDHAEINGVNMMGMGTCAPPPSGNWGFADFTNCGSGTVGASTIATWFASGYPGTVDISKCYSTKPGNFIASIRPELDDLIADQTVFPIPLYDSWSGNGANTHVDLTGFAGFQITSYKATGSQASRYIQGRFKLSICNQGCGTGDYGGNVPGGGMVKLRLASKTNPL